MEFMCVETISVLVLSLEMITSVQNAETKLIGESNNVEDDNQNNGWERG